MSRTTYAQGAVTLWHGDLFDVLPTLTADSVHSVVCDPPYGIAFMGREWDDHDAHGFEDWCKRWASECLRVLRPGGHLVAFGATRTHHRLMAGVEDAGFELRDMGVWLYRSGFPKSHDVSKAIDREAGAEREVVREGASGAGTTTVTALGNGLNVNFQPRPVTAPATEDASRWDGWGTALKPAIEPWVLARKPLSESTVAANVLKWGTGALNVDGCRAPMDGDDRESGYWRGALPEGGPGNGLTMNGGWHGAPSGRNERGRWPANVVTLETDHDLRHFRAHAGPVADFPKASTAEKPWDGGTNSYGRTIRVCNVCDNRSVDSRGLTCRHADFRWEQKDGEHSDELHPTVKPLALMRWLVRLVTPPGGTVLDPFAGTGTTGEAAAIEGRTGWLVEREPGYVPLIARRLSKPLQPTLLGDVS